MGIILIVIGLGITFEGIELNQSLWANLQWIFLNFESASDFIVSFILLLFKAGFIAGGYFYIKYSSGVERARLDDKGFYYREIPKGSGMAKLGIDIEPLSFTPYSAISDISYKKSLWTGGQIIVTLDSGPIPLVALGVLKDDEKKEIVELVKTRGYPGRLD
ncbi:hypothetical protein RG47T_0066 [Mucilaginibacter polytrichastri]|uniref:Uncharacterized protein n=1 Tax=Mucilaginibacter polytrichastri TaxID=1302689 RepID=A0A1Q5ZS90_9SPHI|nr:hypothetical protein RG47T_0066 [Mucilaginibacter polytrichastri]